MAASAAGDVSGLRSLLDEHFRDRSQSFPGDYFVSELLLVFSYAARHDQVAILNGLLPYSSFYTKFATEDALDASATDTLLWFLEQGWDIDQIREAGLTSAVCQLIDHYGGDVHRGQLLHNVLRRWPGDDSANDNIEVMGLLLQRGTPLNRTMYADDAASLSKYRRMDLGTPCTWLPAWANAEVVQYLLSQVVDASIGSTQGRTVLQWAEWARRDNMVAYQAVGTVYGRGDAASFANWRCVDSRE
ncbi:hypothetical protein SEUCBS140593_004454 [Sporothrix eucalyptigena]|uniref:Uncharacterized protein n=1 Tax=Sporothrix eucalyptigena TaxID=1812306 RepID=A0ABP0BNL0_9PEZI